MIAVLPNRRRADAFAAALDSLLDGRDGAHPAYAHPGAADPRFERLLAVVTRLDTFGAAAEPRAGFSADLRERLMRAAETELVVTDDRLLLPAPARPPGRRGRVSAGLATLAVVAGTTGVAVAASGSVPGDPLYPFKQGVEQVRDSLALSGAAHGRDQLRRSEARLDEVSRMLRGEGDEAQLSATVDAFADQADQGAGTLFADYRTHGDDGSIRTVRDFVASAMPRLDDLATEAPASARPALVQAARTLADLDLEAQRLCPGCGSVSTVSVPTDLAAGVARSETLPLADDDDQKTGSPGPAKTGERQTGQSDRKHSHGALPDLGVQTDGAGADQPPLGTLIKRMTGPLPDLGAGDSGRGSGGGSSSGGNKNGAGAGTKTGRGTLGDTTDGVGDTVDDAGTKLQGLIDGLTGHPSGGSQRDAK